MGKRTFTREFKLEAVRMVNERGLGKSQVARDIGVHLNVLRGWLAQHEADPQGAFGGTSAKTVENAQIEQLKRELNHSPQPHTPQNTKAKICALLKECNGDALCAFKKAIDFRKSNLPSSWQNLQNREVDDWLSVLAWPNGLQSDTSAVNFYEEFVKKYLRDVYHTTPYNPEAWGSALDAVNHKNDTPAELAK